MSINRLRTLCVEIYKTLNELNPSFMKNIFMVKETDRLTREQCNTIRSSIFIVNFTALIVNLTSLLDGVNLRIQSDYRKTRTRKKSVFGHFSRCALDRIPISRVSVIVHIEQVNAGWVSYFLIPLPE